MNNQYNHMQTTCDSNVLATLVHETDRMTSLEIAEVTGKRHDNIMRDIRAMSDNLFSQLRSEVAKDYHRGERNQYKYISEKSSDIILDFCFNNDKSINGYSITEAKYKDAQNKERNMYVLNKKACLLLASGYDVLLRAKIIDRWEELERKERQQQEPIDEDKAILFALTTLQKRVEIKEKEIKQLQQQTQALTTQNQLQEHELKIQAPKVEYHDKVLASTSTYDTTQIAKELGMSAITLNKKLQDLKVQYKLSGQWVLYAKYQSKGYTDTRTHQYTDSQGTSRTSMLTVWTEQGRKFIHSLINK